jgi:1,3-beta-glucanosyltransferase GAS1
MVSLVHILLKQSDQAKGLVDIANEGNISLRPNYYALSSQLAAIHPSSTSMAQYSPTNTLLPACTPLIGDFIHTMNHTESTISLNLTTSVPDMPNSRLCSCMMETLSCVSTLKLVSDNSIVTQYCPGGHYDPRFGACRAIFPDWTLGEFGAYSLCTFRQQGSWILNHLYLASNKTESNCTDGHGALQKPVEEKKRNMECASYLRQAGVDGMGRITSTPDPALADVFPDSDTTGLSTKTKVGIAIGVTIFVLLITALAIMTRIRRKRIKLKAEKEDLVIQKTELPATEVNEKTVNAEAPTKELAATEIHEMAAGAGDANELEAEATIELEAEHAQIHELNTDLKFIAELDDTSIQPPKPSDDATKRLDNQ